MNRVLENGDSIILFTTKGQEIIVDRDDYDSIKHYTWSVDKRGYAVANFRGVKKTLHRVIMQPEPHIGIDHINRNPLDNRRSNLRICNQHENMGNMTKPKGKHLSRYKGVTFDRRKEKYMAKITSYGRSHFIGYFDNEADAAVAYNSAARILFGEFSCVNKIAV